MPDYTKIKQALTEAGHTVSPDFDTKMGDPKFVEGVRGALKGEGHNVSDSTAFWQTHSNAMSVTGRGAGQHTKEYAPGTWAKIFHDPKGSLKDLGSAVAAAPKVGYDIARDIISTTAVAPVAATAKQALRGIGNVTSLARVPAIEGKDTKHDAAGKDITTWREDYETSRAGRKEGLAGVASDPLMYVPVGKLAQGLGAGGKLLARVASAVTTKPTAVGEDVVRGLKTASKAKQTEQAAQQAIMETGRLSREPGTFWEATTLDPYLSTQQLNRQLAAADKITKLPPVARAVAKAAEKVPLAPWVLPKLTGPRALQTARAVGAGATGAAEAATIGALERGLNAEEGNADYTPSLLDAVLGGVLGAGGSALQHWGLENYPSMHPSVTNRALDPEKREMLRKELPEILNRGFLPKGKRSLSDMAEHEMQKLGASAYEPAIEAVSSTNAANLPVMYRGKGTSTTDAVDNFAVDIGSIPEASRAATAREKIGIGMERPYSKIERLQTEVDIRRALDQTGLAEHKNGQQLIDMIHNGLAEAKSPADFRRFMGEIPGESSIEKAWLNAPYHGTSVDDIRGDAMARVQKTLLDPNSDIRMVAGTNGPEMPPQVIKEIENKLAALTSAAPAVGLSAKTMSPKYLSDNRTSLTSPRNYKHTTESVETTKAQILANEAIHDALNAALEKIPGYAAKLGDAPGQYAKWRTLMTLAEHPGNLGLATRVFGQVVPPFVGQHAAYKLGRGVENAIPLGMSYIHGGKPKSDSTKIKTGGK